MEDEYDLLVIGSGPAGLAAGIAAGRRGLDAVIFERDSVGGALVNRHSIENLPGRPESTGPELRTTLVEQLRSAGGQVRLAAVDDIRRISDGTASDGTAGQVEDGSEETTVDEPADVVGFEVDTAEGTYSTRTVVIATGSRPIPIDVLGADEYHGRGIFDCAMCDGPLYAGKTVAVSGNNEWALTDALYLTDHAEQVVVIVPDSRLSVRETLRERVVDHPDVEIRTDTEIRGVGGEDVLESLELFDRTESTEYTEPIGGLYVQHGVEPETSALPEWIPQTDCGAVAVDPSLETAVSGLFAAGDVQHSSARTIATALGDGVTVCRSAARYIEE